jgi:predicted nucleotidyltransferase/DNA-binding XRE family transcriptional regulator
MLSHKTLKAQALARPDVKAEYDRLEEEFAILDQFLLARAAAGLTQAQVAERIGTTQSAIARLESGAGRHQPTLGSLRKYAQAVGCRLEFRLVKAPEKKVAQRGTAYRVNRSSAKSTAQVDASRAKLSRLCRKYGIRKLGLFGSAARRELRSTSDVDLLVEFGPESHASLFDFPDMQREFSVVFGNRSVDLVPPQVMRNPHRRKAIMADLTILYQAR